MKKDLPPYTEYRGKCYKCNRPLSSCMCKHVHPIHTNTQFIILMHPKEHQKTKNGTGYMTHLSLPNSQVIRGIDFSKNMTINTIIDNPLNSCYILYPGEHSVNLSQERLPKNEKNLVIFIIDSTWACSRKMLRLSHNLAQLPKVSFEVDKVSNFFIKKQPRNYCLSTIESTLSLLQLLHEQQIETIRKKCMGDFLNPFNKMVEYQLLCAKQNNLREENKK